MVEGSRGRILCGEEDDKDENIEAVYSKTASVLKVEAVKSDNKDDDIDIDAI